MRLIDADELIEHAWRDKLDSRELIAGMIEKAHTVKEIPIKIPIGVFEKLISQEPVLDKIRAEIEHLTYYWCEVNPKTVIDDVLQIIDKYRTESEDNE